MRDFFKYWSIWFRHNWDYEMGMIFTAAIALTVALILMFLATFSLVAHAADFDTNVRAVMNEASNQGPRGMVAAAWVFKNRERAGMPMGSSGLYSQKVRARIMRERFHVWQNARAAVRGVFGDVISDPTNGALWCENVEAFGIPAYIKRGLRAGKIEQCAKISDITFWRPVKKKIKGTLK